LASKTGFINFAMSAVDLEVIEDRKLSLRDVCRAYHTPAVLYGDSEGSTYNNMSEARKDEMVSAILPDVRRFADAFTRWYIRPLYGDDYRLEPLLDDIEELQPDKAQEVTKLMNAVFIPVAEKQRMYGIEADEDLADVYVTPSGMRVDLKDNLAELIRQEDDRSPEA
jgi:phage portal protein BeeE